MDKVTQAIANFNASKADFSDRLAGLDVSDDPKGKVLGREALKIIQQHLGDEAIVQFLRWAVHPRSGFHAQTIQAKPLPEPLHALLAELTNQLNKEIESLPKSPAMIERMESEKILSEPITTQVARRTMLYSLIGGALGATMPTHFDRVTSKAARTVVGSFVGGLTGVLDATGKIERTAQKQGKSRSVYQAPFVRVDPRIPHFDINQIAHATAEVLETLLSEKVRGLQ
jgi:hypothetical protein